MSQLELTIPTDDYPLWMRRAQRGSDWGLWLILGFALLSAWGFLTSSALSTSNANLNHGYLAADFARSLREGHLYPRWSPHALGGYGAPIPNYIPPGAAYSVALIEVLFTNDTTAAMRVIYVLAICAAGIGVYKWVSRRVHAEGGLIAALLYLYSPYFGLTLPHVFGDLPEVLALALLPCLLWSITRQLDLNAPQNMAWTALATAAITLTEPRLLPSAAGFVLVLLCWHGFTAPHKGRIMLVIISLALGIGAAACYWYPVIFEADLIRWFDPPIQAFPYHLTLETLFRPVQQIDSGALIPAPQLTLGWPLLALTVIGGMAILWQPLRHIFAALFLALGSALLFLSVMLFPTEIALLGTITLCYAIGSSAVISFKTLLPRPYQHLFLPILVIVIWIASMPIWLLSDQVYSHETYDPGNQIRYEQFGLGPAVLPLGSPIPSTLPPNFTVDRELINSYQYDSINRIAPAELIRSGQITILSQYSHEARFQVRIDRSGMTTAPIERLTMQMKLAHFPGWQAWFGNIPINVNQNLETGLITLRLPEIRQGELILRFESTPTRTIAWLLTWSACGLIALVTWIRSQRSSDSLDLTQYLTLAQVRLITLILVYFGMILGFSTLPNTPIPLRAAPNSGLIGITPYVAQSNLGLQLIGYQTDRDDPTEITLYWRTIRTLPENYQIRLVLENEITGEIALEAPLRHPGGYPMRRWSAGGYVLDQYRFTSFTTLPAGSYRWRVSVCGVVNCLQFFERSMGQGQEVFYLPPIVRID